MHYVRMPARPSGSVSIIPEKIVAIRGGFKDKSGAEYTKVYMDGGYCIELRASESELRECIAYELAGLKDYEIVPKADRRACKNRGMLTYTNAAGLTCVL